MSFGAGASYEVGFPLGSELKKIISSKLNLYLDSIGRPIGSGDIRILDKLRSKFGPLPEDYLKACWQIRDGIILSDSIDDFINIHQHDEQIATCGKLAIAYSIVDAEKRSKLYFNTTHIDETINFGSIENDWYTKFYSLLTKNIRKANIDTIFDNITVINYNYDRSLEHFLVHAISKNYIIGITEATNIVRKLVIYRPYGTIDQSVEFGSDRLLDVDNILSNLKTYSEQVNDVAGLHQVKQAIQDSHVIVLLGMAYHQNNMFLLQCECNMEDKIIYATRHGISQNDLKIIKGRIMSIDASITVNIDMILRSDPYTESIMRNIFFADECRNLFDEYRYSLSEL